VPLILALPFAGLLLSIALGPLLIKAWWHIHYGKAAAIWAALTVSGLLFVSGLAATSHSVAEALVADYLPFILLLFALYTISGGIELKGRLPASAGVNTGLLAIGAVLANCIGTTGAAMLLLRPLIAANAGRNAAHVVVAFIFIVANIGGALTPLGDPPLFIGFLRGVAFSWTLVNLWQPTLFTVGVLLALFYAFDAWRFARMPVPAREPSALRVVGLLNVPLIMLVVAAVAASGVWKPGVDLAAFGLHVPLEAAIRDGVLLLAGLASLRVTPMSVRRADGFDWEPLVEVAKLFAAIFVCVIPVVAMLQAGAAGPFAPLLALLSNADGKPLPIVQFWVTGALAAVLDNAPTYLVFFELAGGNAAHLMNQEPQTLAALSLGAVFMGAMTYIGNAPNFMVYAIARRSGVEMPSFFGYLVWSGVILLPLFALMTRVFLR
jgi:Na+/H+ antiporter NhaD/arsenite permease-like protein